MKALTLHQPWASLIALGVKTIETRSWSTSYRGPLAIHASAREGVFLPDDPECRLWHWSSQMLIEPKFDNEEVWAHGNPFHPAPVGAVVATCTLTDVVPIFDDEDEGSLPDADSLPMGSAYLTTNEKQYSRDDLRVWVRKMMRVSGADEAMPCFHAERVFYDQRPYGDFTPDRYAWLLDDIERFAEPVPARGRQGLWNWAATGGSAQG